MIGKGLRVLRFFNREISENLRVIKISPNPSFSKRGIYTKA